MAVEYETHVIWYRITARSCCSTLKATQPSLSFSWRQHCLKVQVIFTVTTMSQFLVAEGARSLRANVASANIEVDHPELWQRYMRNNLDWHSMFSRDHCAQLPSSQIAGTKSVLRSLEQQPKGLPASRHSCWELHRGTISRVCRNGIRVL